MNWKKFYQIVWDSFGDLFRPSVLLFPLFTSGLAVLFWSMTIWISWDSLIEYLQSALSSSHWLSRGLVHILSWAEVSTGSFLSIFTGTLVVLLLIPTVIVSAMLLNSFFAMPYLSRRVHQEHFSEIAPQNPVGNFASIRVTLVGSAVFLLGWICLLPLWLFPPLGPLASILLSGWIQYRILSFEVLCEYSDQNEILQIQKRDHKYFFAAGILVSLLWFVPVIQFVTPILASLIFARLSLQALREFRSRL